MKSWVTEHQIFSGIVGAIIMGIISLILNKKEKDQGGVNFQNNSAWQKLKVFRPGLLRIIFDRAFPNIHRKLTLLGSLSKPPEYDILNGYLRNLNARIENDIKIKTYLPLKAREMSQVNFFHDHSEDPFVKPIHQLVRQIIGQSKGGDSASAQIAAVNRRNKLVRNIHKTLMRSKEPLILLGDPGTGKTMTLQQVALSLSKKEIRHIFPNIIIYVRLGEFCQNGKIETKDVINFIKRELPENVKEYIDDMELLERLVVIFDGMDEMCRERYNEHIEALSLFASSRRGRIKSLFSCRITDFSPKFIHQRLVLLPFNRSQIKAYLYKYLDNKYLIINEKKWSIRKLSIFLSKNKLPIETNNPFVLWLLCYYVQNKNIWPKSRIELLDFYCQENLERKQKEQFERGMPFPKRDQVFEEWYRFAYEITSRNMGTAIPVHLLFKEDHKKDSVLEMVRIGNICGMIEEAKDDHEHRIRFEHHRLQEFFAAKYIHTSKQKINWLEKLDAPRWQETIINLTLMGSHFESTYTLVESVDKLLQHIYEVLNYTNENSPTVKQDSLEITLADRIDLASRIIYQIRDNSNINCNAIKETIEKGVIFLLENGNPVSQVKMMHACQKLSNIDVIEALQKPLNSKIGWVRSHALLLIASDRENSQTVGTDITTEMMYDFAQGLFLNRFYLYFKSLISTKSIYYWWSFLTVFIFSIFNIGFTIAISYILYFFAKYISDRLAIIHFFHHHYCLWSYTVIILSAVITGIKREENLLWAIAPVTGSIFLLTIITIPLTWTHGFNIFHSYFFVLIVMFVLGYVVPVYGFVAALIHLISISFALIFTGLVRKPKHPVRSFFLSAWQNCNYEICFLNELSLRVIGFTLFVLIVWSLTLFINFVWKQFLINQFLDSAQILIVQKIEPFDSLFSIYNMMVAIITIVLTLIIILIIKKIKHINFSKKMIEFKKFSTIKWENISSILFKILKCVGFCLIIVIFALTIGFIVYGLNLFTENEQATYIAGKIFSFSLCFLFALSFIYVFFVALKNIAESITWRRTVYPVGSFSPEDWIKSFKQSNSKKQHKLLMRSNHESLNLSAGEFLSLMIQIKDDVLGDPSASTYWEQRYQLEQILKHEKC